MRAVSAMGLTTVAARIIVHIWTGASVFQVYVNIFHILSCSEHEPAPCMCTSSSNERCTNKCSDTAVRLIMNVKDYCDNSKRY